MKERGFFLNIFVTKSITVSGKKVGERFLKASCVRLIQYKVAIV